MANLGSGIPYFCPHTLPRNHFHHPIYLLYFVHPETRTACQNTKTLKMKRIEIEFITSK